MVNTVRLGISSPTLVAKLGLSWILRQQHITCLRWPKMGEELTVLTAPTGFARGLLTYRDFHLVDASGTSLISAVSEWLLMDMDSRMLRPIPPHIAVLEQHLAPAAAHLDRPGGKLKPPATPTNIRQTTVSYGMLDFNDHLTNPVFPELMLEPLERDFLSNHVPKKVKISFQAEARYGETLVATVGGTGDQRQHALYRGDDLLAVMGTEWGALA